MNPGPSRPLGWGRTRDYTAGVPGRPTQHVAFALVFVAALGLRIALLLTSQSHVDGDEAVVGIMARHVVQGARPLLFYGQGYGGGAAIEAYLAAVPFVLAGASSVALKSVSLALSMLALALVHALTFRRLGGPVALAAVVILASATALLEWNLKTRGGYAALPVFLAAILLVYSRIVYDGAAGWRSLAALGGLSGLAVYSQPLIGPWLVALALAARCWPLIFGRVKALVALLGGFSAGMAPWLAGWLSRSREAFVSTSTVPIPIPLESAAPEVARGWLADGPTLLRFPLHELPGFFVGRNADQLVEPVSILAYVECAIYGLLVALAIVRRRADLRAIAIAWWPGRRATGAPSFESLLVLGLIVHLAACAIRSAVGGGAPRYLLPVYPALAIVAGASVVHLLRAPGLRSRAVGAVAIAGLVGLGLWNAAPYVGPSWVTDDVRLADARVVNRRTAGEAMAGIEAVLREHGVGHVRTTYFTQWRLLFETGERVIASSADFGIDGAVRYPAYDRAVRDAERVATVVHRDSLYALDQPGALRSLHAAEVRVGDYLVLLPP